MIQRALAGTIRRWLTQFPAVGLLGPRQCGKSTLAKQLLAEIPQAVYLDLERPADLNRLRDPEAFFAAQFKGQPLRREQDVSCQAFVLFGQVIQGTNGLFRDDQKMHGCLWGDIVESQYLIIFVDDLCRDFPIDDLGEQSIHSRLLLVG